eukprot:4966488-Alexandrium_andersonii.AAC.1
MSASLVGSEMCIRDRVFSKAGNLPKVGGPYAQGSAPGTPRFGRRPWGRAVSYTHLTLPTICSV